MEFSEDVLKLNPELTKGVDSRRNPSKYHNARTEAAGMTFDSGKEAAYISNLIILEEHKKIFGLRLQVRFPLAGGIIYIADAVYLDEQLQPHIIDVKGFKTETYRMKKKLFKEQYGRDIEEI